MLTRKEGNEVKVIAKNSKRIFIAHEFRSSNIRVNYTKSHEMPVRGLFKLKGQNKIATEYERNIYSTDDIIRTRTQLDNSACSSRVKKLVCKL